MTQTAKIAAAATLALLIGGALAGYLLAETDLHWRLACSAGGVLGLAVLFAGFAAAAKR